MRIFKRVSQSVSFGFESLLDSLENQEAVARATIREVEAGAGRVRVRRQAIERELAGLGARGAELAREAELWKERATRLAADTETALECLRRRKLALAEQQALEGRAEAQRALLQQIRGDEHAIAAKLGELRQREAALVSREALAGAEAAAGGLAGVDGVFDRWEARVQASGASAASSAGPAPADAFERGLSEQEERAALLAELAALSAREVSS